MPPEAQRRIDGDDVVWLTTVTDSGVPAPNPVWFVPDGDELVVFSSPRSRRVHNLGSRPSVSLNFNTDAGGGDVVVLAGTATLTPNVTPSRQRGFLDKYRTAITEQLGTTVEDIDATYSTEIRIRPSRIRLL